MKDQPGKNRNKLWLAMQNKDKWLSTKDKLQFARYNTDIGCSQSGKKQEQVMASQVTQK